MLLTILLLLGGGLERVVATEALLLDGDSIRSDGATGWRMVTDRVMGGVSQASLDLDEVQGRPCLRLRGRVSTANGGGFVQMALDLASAGASKDLSAHEGVRVQVLGNGERYGLHLRTIDVTKPWQSYRAEFVAPPEWTDVYLPFTTFRPHRLTKPLDTGRLIRLGIVAIGRPMRADVCVAELEFYR